MAETHRINLSVQNKDPQKTGIIMRSGDKGIILDISIADFDTSDTTAQIVFHKQNNEVIESVIEGENNRYTYEIQGNEISYPGIVVADVKFRTTDSRTSTCKFVFTVDSDTLNDSPLESGAYSASLDEAINRAIAAAELAEQAAEDATTGVDGFSPTIIENPLNDATTYKLDITTKTDSFTTPNLKGADGADGIGGGGTAESTTYDNTTSNATSTNCQGAIDELFSEKFDKANIVNNNTVAVDGFALSARQANPSEPGSLGAQIATLNDNLTVEDYTPTALTGFTLINNQFKKIGNRVVFNARLSTSVNISANTETGVVTIPEGVRPVFEIVTSALCVNSTSLGVKINSFLSSAGNYKVYSPTLIASGSILAISGVWDLE